MNHFTGIRTVGVPVTDQDRAVTFYTETLGFELLMDAPLPQFGGRWIVVAPAGAAVEHRPGAGLGGESGRRRHRHPAVEPGRAGGAQALPRRRDRHRRTARMAGRSADVQPPRPGREQALRVSGMTRHRDPGERGAGVQEGRLHLGIRCGRVRPVRLQVVVVPAARCARRGGQPDLRQVTLGSSHRAHPGHPSWSGPSPDPQHSIGPRATAGLPRRPGSRRTASSPSTPALHAIAAGSTADHRVRRRRPRACRSSGRSAGPADRSGRSARTAPRR